MGVLVSAVITTCKREPEIVARALASVMNQTYKNLEIIVVDDSPVHYELRASVKKTVQSFGDRVKYIQHEVNQGACAARNTGLMAANGEYIGFLDDDDEWKETKIEKQLCAFTSDKIALVYCGWETIGDISAIANRKDTIFKSGMVYDSLILQNFIGSTSFPLIKRKCLLEIGGFDVLMKSAQDYDVWLRLAERYEINYVPEPLVRYHVHEGEQISKNPQNRIRGLERFNEKNIEYLKKHKAAWWIRYIKLSPEYAKAGQLKKALTIWVSASLKCPYKFYTNMKYLYCVIYCYRKRNNL